MDPFNTDSDQPCHSELEAAIASLNRASSDDRSESDAAAGTVVNVISKIEWLESELVQQKKNFENVDRRFDDLSNQLAALCNAITSSSESSPTTTAESFTTEPHAATDMDCTHSPEVVSEGTGGDSHENTNKMCESVGLPLTESIDDVTDQLLQIRTRGAASFDSLLAKLNAVDSGPECVAKEHSQPDAGPELQSILPETSSIEDAVEQQRRKLEELFASMRNRDEESPAENSLSSKETVVTPSDNRVEFGQQHQPQYSPADSISTELEQESAQGLAVGLQRSPEPGDDESFDRETERPVQDVEFEETVAADVTPATPESFVTTPATSLMAEHGDGNDVQDYMNSLLQRLKGGEPAKPPVASTVVNAATPARKMTEAPVNPDFRPVAERLNPDEYRPKRVAPEKNANMTAMRELANASSRSAVKSSELRRQKANANLQLILTGSGIAGAAFTSAMSQSRGDLFFYLSISLLVVSMACIYFYARAQIYGQNEESGSSVADPLSGETAGFDWSKLNEFTTVILNKLNRSPKESS